MPERIKVISVASFEHSVRAPRTVRFFGTFRRFQDPAWRTGKATHGWLVNPPLLVNLAVIPGAGDASRGEGQKKKNYDRHGSRITLGNGPR